MILPSIEPGACLEAIPWAPGLFAWSCFALAGVVLLLTSALASLRVFPGRPWLLGVQVCAAAWLLLSGLTASAGTADCQSTLMQLQRPMMMGVPALWLAFVVQYSGSRTSHLPTWCMAAAIVPWLLFSLATLTNGWHGLFFGPFDRESGSWRFAPALLTPISRTWVYMLLGLAVALLARQCLVASRPDRWRWLGLIAACTVPWLLTLAHQLEGWNLGGHDPTALGFVGYCLVFASLSLRRHTFNLAPHARNLLFSETSDPLLVVDAEHLIVEMNHACDALGGGLRVRGQALQDWAFWGPTIAPHLVGNGTPFILSADSGDQHFEARVHGIRIGNQTIGHLVHLHDVSELVRARASVTAELHKRERELVSIEARQAELVEASLQDPLTGLHNRRALERSFAEEVAHARKTEHPLSLAMIDLDHFKRVNDTYGHAGGDDVLVALARHLQRGLRSTDSIFRVGGEEFVILLPAADGAQAFGRIDRLRQGFTSVQTRSGAQVSVTFSGGVAQWHELERDLDELLARADTLLYRAKAGGRDRIEFDRSSEPLAPMAGCLPAATSQR